MTTVNIQGKTLTSVEVSNSLASYYADESKNHADESKQYRDETQNYAEIAMNAVSNIDEQTNTSISLISNSADLAIEEINEAANDIFSPYLKITDAEAIYTTKEEFNLSQSEIENEITQINNLLGDLETALIQINDLIGE